MFLIFIWQNQCEASPCTQLIGSFSVGILQNGNGPSRVFLFLSKASKFKIGSQTEIKTIVIPYSETTRKSLKDWNFPQISMMDEEDEHSPTNFIILRIWKLLIQKLKQVSSEDHRRFYQTTENCKHKQEDTDTNTFLFGGGGGGGCLRCKIRQRQQNDKYPWRELIERWCFVPSGVAEFDTRHVSSKRDSVAVRK